jgi:hypothetical protein
MRPVKRRLALPGAEQLQSSALAGRVPQSTSSFTYTAASVSGRWQTRSQLQVVVYSSSDDPATRSVWQQQR